MFSWNFALASHFLPKTSPCARRWIRARMKSLMKSCAKTLAIPGDIMSRTWSWEHSWTNSCVACVYEFIVGGCVLNPVHGFVGSLFLCAWIEHDRKLCARITLSPENISVRGEMNSRKNEEFDEILRKNFCHDPWDMMSWTWSWEHSWTNSYVECV